MGQIQKQNEIQLTQIKALLPYVLEFGNVGYSLSPNMMKYHESY